MRMVRGTLGDVEDTRSVQPGRLDRRVTGFAVVMLVGVSLSLHTGAAPSRKSAAGKTLTAQAAKEDPQLAEARERFRQGVEFVKQAKWSEALDAFDASRALRPHAVTTFNIGACERALGRYTRARAALRLALEEERATPGQLTGDVTRDLNAFLLEIEQLLAHVDLEVTPPGALLAVDGRPIASGSSAEGPEYVAGIAPPSAGELAPVGRFKVVLDPGAHVFVFRRKGYADAVVRRQLRPGERARLDARLEQLPASIQIDANVRDSLVWFNGADVGPVPVNLLRPPGTHEILVRREGYDPYTARLTAHPGEALQLSARLQPERPSLFTRWWFWTGAVAAVGAATLATFALTREDKPPPPYNGGSTGWVAFPDRQ